MDLRHTTAKLQLATSFAELVEEMPADRITVNMIVDKLGKHRKTFYYHFCDKEQLIVWLFRYDLACSLQERFSIDVLLFENECSPYAQFPYYVRNEKESGRMFNAPFFSVLATVLERRRVYYRRILALRGPGSLDFYLHQLYYPAMRDDVVFLLEREIGKHGVLQGEQIRSVFASNDCIDFLAEFYTDAFLTRFAERLIYSPTRRSSHDIYPFENVVHDSMESLVQQQVTRIARKLEEQGRDC